MPEMNAKVTTGESGRLINRLCKHFSHKIKAEWTDSEGLLTFSIGQCHLSDRGDHLLLACSSPNESELQELGEVVASHLIRFAGTEVSSVQWQAAG